MLVLSFLSLAIAGVLANPVLAPVARTPVVTTTNPASSSSSAPASSSSASPPPPPPVTATTLQPPSPDCTSTLRFLNPLNDSEATHGPVRTVWTTTVTATTHLDCGGCRFLATERAPAGHGPVVHFTTTTTVAEPRTETAYSCFRKPSSALQTTNGPPSTQSPSPPAPVPTAAAP